MSVTRTDFLSREWSKRASLYLLKKGLLFFVDFLSSSHCRVSDSLKQCKVGRETEQPPGWEKLLKLFQHPVNETTKKFMFLFQSIALGRFAHINYDIKWFCTIEKDWRYLRPSGYILLFVTHFSNPEEKTPSLFFDWSVWPGK